jgi:hypothetical protein
MTCDGTLEPENDQHVIEAELLAGLLLLQVI